ARFAFEDEFGAAEEREVSCKAQKGQSGVKRKLFESCRNNIGNEPILALPEGSNNFVVMRGARERRSEAKVAFKDEFGVAEEREVSCKAQQGQSGVKRKLFESCRNNMGVVTARPSTIWERANVVVDAWSRKGGVKPRRRDVAWLGLTNGEKRWWWVIIFGYNLDSYGRRCKDFDYGGGACDEVFRSSLKDERQRSLGLLLQPEIPDCKWEKERLTMDSKSKLPRSSSRCDAIWVIVDRLTKLSYFLAIRKEYKME
nr:reverse transcriptase domain-containing protein [Tanacetum cinerariifolium]